MRDYFLTRDKFAIPTAWNGADIFEATTVLDPAHGGKNYFRKHSSAKSVRCQFYLAAKGDKAYEEYQERRDKLALNIGTRMRLLLYFSGSVLIFLTSLIAQLSG
jgi:hypothetical protein